jgi:cyclic pyranopterin phosphate synthase
MPEEGVEKQAHQQILRYEELLRIARVATSLGIDKIRVTGGEPLVRKGVIPFLQQLTELVGVNDVALTTNGFLLGDMAQPLLDAGVKRINVSLDSLNEQLFSEITRGGMLRKVLSGIYAADAIGLQIKINMVVMRGINDHEINDFARLSVDKPWSVRFIEYMPTIREPDFQERLLSGEEVLSKVRQEFEISSLESSAQCGPARPFKITGAQGTVGIITPMSNHFCASCNRLRITSEGMAKSCLLSEESVDLKPCLKQEDDNCLLSLLEKIVSGKPSRHTIAEEDIEHKAFTMSSIGG